jgi:hypothetical protein
MVFARFLIVRDAIVFPYRRMDPSAQAFADKHNAELPATVTPQVDILFQPSPS